MLHTGVYLLLQYQAYALLTSYSCELLLVQTKYGRFTATNNLR